MILLVVAKLESTDESNLEHKNINEPKEKPKNILECSIACVAKRSRLKPRLGRLRMNAVNIFSLELPEFQGQNYIKKLTCPKCMGNMEITVRREKAGLLYYKLVVLIFGLIFVGTNVLLLQQGDITSSMNTLMEANTVIVGGAIVLLILIFLNNFIKTRTPRSIRLKMKAESRMAHKLYKGRRREYKKKTVKIQRS